MKQRLEIQSATKPGNALSLAGVGPVAKVVDVKDGSVGWLDKLKAYYHTLIVVVGGAALLLNQVQPIVNGQYKAWVSLGIVVATGLATFLKNNETWVDSL